MLVCLFVCFLFGSKCSQWHTILATSNFSLKIMVLVFKNSLSDELLVCEWVNSVDSRTYLNRRRWIDSERDTAVCPFISGVHGRAQQ